MLKENFFPYPNLEYLKKITKESSLKFFTKMDEPKSHHAN